MAWIIPAIIAGAALSAGSNIYKAHKEGEYQEAVTDEERRYQEELKKQARKNALSRAIGAEKMADLWSGYGPARQTIEAPNLDLANIIGGLGQVGGQAGMMYGATPTNPYQNILSGVNAATKTGLGTGR